MQIDCLSYFIFFTDAMFEFFFTFRILTNFKVVEFMDVFIPVLSVKCERKYGTKYMVIEIVYRYHRQQFCAKTIVHMQDWADIYC